MPGPAREKRAISSLAGAKTASRSSAILAKFYDVCSRDVPSPGENASFRFPADPAVLQCSPLLPPPPLRAPWVYGQGETGVEMTLGTDRGPTARETCANLEILRNALCSKVRAGSSWVRCLDFRRNNRRMWNQSPIVFSAFASLTLRKCVLCNWQRMTDRSLNYWVS